MTAVEINNQIKARIDKRSIKETIKQVLKCLPRLIENIKGGNKISQKFKSVNSLLHQTDNFEISVGLVDKQTVRRLNRQYRGIDKVTDILSFGGIFESQFPIYPASNLCGHSRFLGEIIICYPRAERQAKERGHGIKEEINILLIHGLLHLLGYDHEKEREAKAMEALEKELLRICNNSRK